MPRRETTLRVPVQITETFEASPGTSAPALSPSSLSDVSGPVAVGLGHRRKVCRGLVFSLAREFTGLSQMFFGVGVFIRRRLSCTRLACFFDGS